MNGARMSVHLLYIHKGMLVYNKHVHKHAYAYVDRRNTQYPDTRMDGRALARATRLSLDVAPVRL